VDHLAFPGLDERGLPRHVDQVAQLSLRLERPVAIAAAGSHGVGEDHQKSGHRAEHPAELDKKRRGQQCHTVSMLAAERARRDPDDDKGDHDHHPDGDQQVRPETADHVDHGQRDQDGSGRLRCYPHEGRHGQVSRTVTEDGGQRGRPPPGLLDELARAVAGEA
jgi:hypothetical protein